MKKRGRRWGGLFFSGSR